MSAPQKPDWANDELVVVTSGSIEEIVELLEEDEHAMFVWLKVLNQLRPTKDDRFPVELDREDEASAKMLVSLKLLTRDPEEVDRYWVDRKVAYADYAPNVLKKELN